MNSDPGNTPLLELVDVSVIRGGNRILDRLCMRIPSGRHTAVLGPNGAGKTSLLNLLLRKFYPSVEEDGQQGEVKIMGVGDWEVVLLHRQMGVVTSMLDHSFSVGRTGRMLASEAVASGITATELAEFGVELTPDVVRQVQESLGRVDACHLIDRRVSTLSTGERRRVLIARALIHRPQILVLDEPTTGLDIAARHHFLMMLRQIAQSQQITLVIVTHHVEEIIPEVEHVVLLDRGRITFDGAKQTALEAVRLSEMYQLPIRVDRCPDGTYRATVESRESHH